MQYTEIIFTNIHATQHCYLLTYCMYVSIPHVYGSLRRWKHWSVRQIKPAQLAFGRTL